MIAASSTMPRRDFRQNRVRVLTFSGAAAVILLALWAANVRLGYFDPPHWRQVLRGWWSGEVEGASAPAISPPRFEIPDIVSSKPANSVPVMLPGTNSASLETPLTLVLVSTTRGRNAREGTAQLGTHAGNPQTYAAGAILTNGSRITEIYNDHVVLERDGRKATLYVATAGKNSGLSDLLLVGGKPASDSQPTPTIRVPTLTDFIRPSPIYDGRVIAGYQVFAGQRSGVFAQLGLKDGDIVRSLDGAPLPDHRRTIDGFSQLMTGRTISATVERNGRIEQVTLDGRVISSDTQERSVAALNTSPPL